MSECNPQDSNPDVRTQLLELYTRLAQEPDLDFGWGKGKENARQLGYTEAWLSQLPRNAMQDLSIVNWPGSQGIAPHRIRLARFSGPSNRRNVP